MKYILQIHTGSWHTTQDRPETLLRKIKDLISRIPVDKVIIGWNPDLPVYADAAAFLHKSGIQMLLWLPVFSETGEVSETDAALDLFGREVITPAEQEEGFRFVCPSSHRNIRIPENLYDRFFSGCGFDGVFLDRIRSQSFLSGVSGVLSCGCGRCRKAFLEKGADPDGVRRQYELKKDSFFDMADFPMNGRFEMKDPLAQRFFEAKEEIIADAAAAICRFFKEKGLTVGLDLFAPVLSRFVGQNYSLLAKHADFIKPMLYRRTEAPAGIGYEYALFEKSAPGAHGRREFSMDRSFLETQLEAIRNVPCMSYPGIEINYSEAEVRTDPDYITASIAAIRDYGFERAALCWDAARAPDAHIAAVSKLENGLPNSGSGV